jgi:hypothetical protein
VGGTAGLAAATYLLHGTPKATPLHYVGTASLGISSGVLLHVLSYKERE